MMELLKEFLEGTDYTQKEKLSILRKAEEDIMNTFSEEGIMDELGELLSLNPLNYLMTSNGQENDIFIGIEEQLEDNDNGGVLVPFSVIDQTIPPPERLRVNNVLIEKGYGLYKPDFWLGLTDDKQLNETPYKSNEKLP